MTDESSHNQNNQEQPELRRGWTTGACAIAATKAALTALITGEFPDPVGIILPKGDVPYFQLAYESLGEGYAMAGIIKDSGDEPDAIDGAMIIATVFPAPPRTGIVFQAGDGVGTVTRAGLQIPVGEAAINPTPRRLITEVCEEICAQYDLPADLVVTISVPEGSEIAQLTMNPQLGITGGISILGSTGIVQPYSCSTWINTVHESIDLAQSEGVKHILAVISCAAEDAAQALYDLPENAVLETGDHIGDFLEYLRQHPIDKVTIAGSFNRLTKLAQGELDLHAARTAVDKDFLWGVAKSAGAPEEMQNQILFANTALEVLELTQAIKLDLARPIAEKAKETVLKKLNGALIEVELIVADYDGNILARS